MPPSKPKEQPYFKYTPLSRENGTIRLIHLKNGASSDPIRCEMWEESLDLPIVKRQKVFDAVSYVWGSPQESRRWIHLNNTPFHVQPNLYAALRAIRSLVERDLRVSAVLWVDAICINQSDLDERNQQVSLMRQIYGQALHTLAWLGPAADASEIAFRWMGTFDSLEGEPEYTGEIKDAVVAICNREYWTRAWVQQELYLAEYRSVLLCGDSAAYWPEFCNACIGANSMYEATIRTPASFLLRGRRDATLEEWIDRRTTDFSCSDVRDRVFSILSMASDIRDDKSKLMADYTITAQLLYFGVMSICQPENPMLLGTPLALMLDSRRIDLVELFSRTDREQGDSSAGSAAGKLANSIWVDQGQKFLQEMRHLTDAADSDYTEGILVEYSTPLEHYIFSHSNCAGHQVGIQFKDAETTLRVYSQNFQPGDIVYKIQDTDTVFVCRKDIFGAFVKCFARQIGPNEWREFQPEAPPGKSTDVERAREAVITILKRTAEQKERRGDLHGIPLRYPPSSERGPFALSE